MTAAAHFYRLKAKGHHGVVVMGMSIMGILIFRLNRIIKHFVSGGHKIFQPPGPIKYTICLPYSVNYGKLFSSKFMGWSNITLMGTCQSSSPFAGSNGQVHACV